MIDIFFKIIIYMQLLNEEINIDNIDSINSIDSKYWGKHTWIFLNSIALT